MSLGLAIAYLEPVLLGLTEVIVDRLLRLRVYLPVLKEKTATIEVEGDGRRQVIVLLLSVL